MRRIFSILLTVCLLLSVCAVQMPAEATAYRQSIGDVNADGKINTTDALMVLRHAVGKTLLTDDNYYMGDVNLSGKVDTTDALMVLRHAVSGSPAFPECANADFTLHLAANSDFNILQLTDTELMDPLAARTQTRRDELQAAYFTNQSTDKNARLYDGIRRLVAKSNPVLIVVTGDLILGETDDTGVLWKEFITFMDSFNIPWALTFGEHDNESAMGVNWQIEQLAQCKNCLFKRGSVTGNSNYSIALEKNQDISYLIYLFDTNGCTVGADSTGLQATNKDIGLITQQAGIYPDQLAWYRSSWTATSNALRKSIRTVAFFHQPPAAVDTVYDQTYHSAGTPFTADQGKDSGSINQFAAGGHPVDADGSLKQAAGSCECVGLFFGHEHLNNALFYSAAPRLYFGLKTGSYGEYDNLLQGGTLIHYNQDIGGIQVSDLSSLEVG